MKFGDMMQCTMKRITILNWHAQPMFAFYDLVRPRLLSSSERLVRSYSEWGDWNISTRCQTADKSLKVLYRVINMENDSIAKVLKHLSWTTQTISWHQLQMRLTHRIYFE